MIGRYLSIFIALRSASEQQMMDNIYNCYLISPNIHSNRVYGKLAVPDLFKSA